jgi:hypothetical protein
MKKIILFLILILSFKLIYAETFLSNLCTCSSTGSTYSSYCGSNAYYISNNCGGCVVSWSGRSCSSITCDWNNLWNVGDGCVHSSWDCNCGCKWNGWYWDQCPSGSRYHKYSCDTCHSYTCYDVKSQTASSGQVTCKCNTGWSDCTSGSGCETSISYNDAACGSCTPCAANFHCINYGCADPKIIARVAVDYKNGADVAKGINHVGTTNCEAYPHRCTSPLHGWDGNNGGDLKINKITVVGYIKCSSGVYKNCNYAIENAVSIITGSTDISAANSFDGCESDIRHSNSACGACGTSCITANQWCWQGSCISKIGPDFTHGGCSGSTATCPTNSVVDSSGVYGINTCTWGGSPKCDCNAGWKNCDGTAGSSCEQDIYSNILNCGSCGYKCIDAPDAYQCTGYTLGGLKSKCEYKCTTGACSAKTLATGQCDVHKLSASTQCKSTICINSNTINNIDNGKMWCCDYNTECSYDGNCYANNAALPGGVNGKFYYCSANKWIEVSPYLNLSKMINYDHSLPMNNINYFSDLGSSSSCISNAFSACTNTAPAYSYKYCFNYNIVFDGMFNIEANNNVPILVSEQDLYNPYYKPDVIVSKQTICHSSGTTDGVMYCAD